MNALCDVCGNPGLCDGCRDRKPCDDDMRKRPCEHRGAPAVDTVDGDEVPFPPEPPDDDPGESDAVDDHTGHLRFARRFVTRYGGRFLHAHGIGWHEFDGSRWAVCADGAATRAVGRLVRDAWCDLGKLGKDDSDPRLTRKSLMRDIQRCETAPGIAGVLDLAGKLHPCTVAAAALDSDPYLLNTRGGTADLRTGAVRACDPADRITKVTTASLDPAAQSDEFDAFLCKIQPEPEMRAFLARSLGSALLGRVREHALLIWFGTGANGKGTLRDAVAYALGDYGIEVPSDLLLISKWGTGQFAADRMRLRGARLAFCSEIAEGAKLDESTMKKLTGGDPVNACLKYRNPVQFDPSHTLVMLTNHLPQVRGDDPATWRRILAVPFAVVVADKEQDTELPERLRGCADAVLAWLWGGWLDYQKQGLAPPKAVLDATRRYQHDSDVVARFMDPESGQVVLGRGSVPSGQLYAAFTAWCRTEGEGVAMSNKAFTAVLEKHGHRRLPRRNRATSWAQIMLAEGPGEQIMLSEGPVE